MSPGKDASHETDPADAGGPPLRVLVVEDSRAYAALIEDMLGGGFETVRAETLEEAVAATRSAPPFDCVLLDLGLPGTRRLEAVEAMHVLVPNAPLVVLTGMEDGGLALEAMKTGVQDFLYKGEIESEPLRRSVRFAIERRNAQAAHEALHDALTGLPNRTLFRDRCLQALAGVGRGSAGVGVLFIDLDGFKQVNDSLGHAAGDRLLVEAADRVRHALRAGDTVSRFGGDELTVLAASIENRHDAVELAQRLSRALAAPYTVTDREVLLTSSIGIALAFDGDADPDTLIHEADLAMYRAKERGGACHEVFGPSLRASTERRREMERDLRAALAHGELRVAYQSQVDLDDGGVTGVEALARWQHPERGMIAAGDFIRVAEDTGMIHGLGRWVLAEACREYARCVRAGDIGADVELAVNLSPRQLARADVVDATAAALAETGIDPAKLCLEVTENAVVGHAARAGSVLRRLKALGVRIAIDDFGVGYASLGYLERFPIDVLKIDRSLVQGVNGETRKQRVVATVMALAETLGLTVVAEGIEEAEDAERLRALGCRRGQGYLFARPAIGLVPQPL